MSHTKEPWRVCGRTVSGPKGLLIEDSYGEAIAVVHEGGCDDEADARRIVAAVNACAGIPTDALESGVARQVLDEIEAAVKLEKQRDELLAALEELHRVNLNNYKHDPDDYKNTRQCQMAEAAIASVKGGAA